MDTALTKIIGKSYSHFEKIGEDFLSFSQIFLMIFVSVVTLNDNKCVKNNSANTLISLQSNTNSFFVEGGSIRAYITRPSGYDFTGYS